MRIASWLIASRDWLIETPSGQTISFVLLAELFQWTPQTTVRMWEPRLWKPAEGQQTLGPEHQGCPESHVGGRESRSGEAVTDQDTSLHPRRAPPSPSAETLIASLLLGLVVSFWNPPRSSVELENWTVPRKTMQTESLWTEVAGLDMRPMPNSLYPQCKFLRPYL